MYSDDVPVGSSANVCVITDNSDTKGAAKVELKRPSLVEYENSEGEDWDAEMKDAEVRTVTTKTGDYMKQPQDGDAEVRTVTTKTGDDVKQPQDGDAEVRTVTTKTGDYVKQPQDGDAEVSTKKDCNHDDEDDEMQSEDKTGEDRRIVIAQEPKPDRTEEHQAKMEPTKAVIGTDSVLKSTKITMKDNDDELSNRYGGKCDSKKKKGKKFKLDRTSDVAPKRILWPSSTGKDVTERKSDVDHDAPCTYTHKDDNFSHKEQRPDHKFSTPKSSHTHRDNRNRDQNKFRQTERLRESTNGDDDSPSKRPRDVSSGEAYPQKSRENKDQIKTDKSERRSFARPREASYADDDSPNKRPQDVSAEQWKFAPPAGFVGVAGKDNILSNFYRCDLIVYGTEFWSTEQAYQWRKAKIMGNDVAVEEIYAAWEPSTAKRLANKHFRGCNLDKWIAVRIPVMRQLLRAKARCCENFRDKIRSSGDRTIAEIVKGDQVWGIGDGTGQNILGRLLMELRNSLDSALQSDPVEDGKLCDFPPEDAFMLPYPLLPSTSNIQDILVITTPELRDFDYSNLVPTCNFKIKPITLMSIKEAHNYILQCDQYDTIALHLLSRETVLQGVSLDQIVDDMNLLIKDIRSKLKDTKICVSLPISPCDFAVEQRYDEKPDRMTMLSDRLSQKLFRDSKVCCQPNKLSISPEECFTDGELSSKAKLAFKYNFERLLYYHVSTPSSYNRERSGSKRQRSNDRDRGSWRRQNSDIQESDADSSFNDSYSASRQSHQAYDSKRQYGLNSSYTQGHDRGSCSGTTATYIRNSRYDQHVPRNKSPGRMSNSIYREGKSPRSSGHQGLPGQYSQK